MPVIRSIEQYEAVPFPLVDGLPRMIGWQWKPASKGGPAFVLIKRGAMGSPKVVERFPLTQEGWARAWRAYASESPEAAEKCRAQLRVREREQRELNHRFGQTPSRLSLTPARSPVCGGSPC
jgi:anti-sigma factor RsiW